MRFPRFFILILIPAALFASWEILDLPTDRGFTGIWALSEDEIFVIGHQGLWKTFDGTNWELDTVGGNLYFVDDTLGFLTGHIITTDGGHTWQKGDTVNGFLYHLSFPRNQSDIGFGHGLYDIRKTTDGGWHWENLSPFPEVYPGSEEEIIAEQLCFSSHPDTGYVAVKCVEVLGNNEYEERFSYFKTTDGGQTWVLNEEGLWNEDFVPRRFAFPEDATTGYMMSRGRVLKTLDGGATWDTVLVDTNMYMGDIHFPEANQWGYVIGSNKAYRTLDAGQSWQHHEFEGDTLLRYCHFVDNRLGFITGIDNIELNLLYDPGFVLKTTDGLLGISEEDWTPVEPNLIEASGPTIFSGELTVNYLVRESGEIQASLYDVSGSLLEPLTPTNTVRQSGSLSFNSELPAGVYFVRLEFESARGNQTTSVRAVKVR